ncbi:hypothetical protein L6452_44733 [Arctium lappa]|nr:hypothetical protein L6452_44733 [Arctium lappa]
MRTWLEGRRKWVSNFTRLRIRITLRFEPSQCAHCNVFGHKSKECAKAIALRKKGKEVKQKMDKDGFTRMEHRHWKPKAVENQTDKGSLCANQGKATVMVEKGVSSAPNPPTHTFMASMVNPFRTYSQPRRGAPFTSQNRFEPLSVKESSVNEVVETVDQEDSVEDITLDDHTASRDGHLDVGLEHVQTELKG